jgi:electron transfer flavoprotein alpha subunit
MALAINKANCNSCGDCIGICPFSGLEMKDGYPQVTAACRICTLCRNACDSKAIVLIDEPRQVADKSEWNGIMVFGEMQSTASGARLHPVVRELIGKAIDLAGTITTSCSKTDCPVSVVLIGENVKDAAQESLTYGADKVLTYEHEALRYFKADSYTWAFSDAIRKKRPEIVLIGATSVGRSLAPCLSTRFRTGLTADCTSLGVGQARCK